MTRAAASISTRERILEASNILFNEHGVYGTALYRIAASLGISAGSLTYHFKTKNEIVNALAHVLDIELERVLAACAATRDAAKMVESLKQLFGLLWRFRFLFNDFFDHATVELVRTSRYRSFHDKLREMVVDHFESALASQIMRTPNSVVLLADNAVAIWMDWLRRSSVEDARGLAAPVTALRDGLAHHFSLIDPYLSTAFARDLLHALYAPQDEKVG